MQTSALSCIHPCRGAAAAHAHAQSVCKSAQSLHPNRHGLHACAQGKWPATRLKALVEERARARAGRAWRHSTLVAARDLAATKLHPKIRGGEQRAFARAFAQLQGFRATLLQRAGLHQGAQDGQADPEATATISGLLAACAEQHPDGAAVQRGVCERTQHDGEHLNAQEDRTPVAQWLHAQLAAWLSGAQLLWLLRPSQLVVWAMLV